MSTHKDYDPQFMVLPKGPVKQRKGPNQPVKNGKTFQKEGRDRTGGKKQTLTKSKREEGEIKDLVRRIAVECPLPGHQWVSSVPEAVTLDDGTQITSSEFSSLPISTNTLRGLRNASFVFMTPVQSTSIPHALADRDIHGEARTGSGKTLAFVVPLLEKLFRHCWSAVDGLGALVITPTRELAVQIYDVLTTVGKFHDYSCGCFIGGRGQKDDKKMIGAINIMVATPGRLLDHLESCADFDVSNLQMLILDEADRLIDEGFQESINIILSYLPPRQTLFFSATLRSSANALAELSLSEPERISINSSLSVNLRQHYLVAPLERKIDVLFSFLRSHFTKKIIVFVSTCKQVRFLHEAFRLIKTGANILELHGRMSQQKRLDIIGAFSERPKAVTVICTDVAARGLHFDGVDWVVHADCPTDVDTYIHRSGRTARLNATGSSLLLLGPSELNFISELNSRGESPRLQAMKAERATSIQARLQSLCAAFNDLHERAIRAFVCYFKSISLQPDKKTFQFDEVLKSVDGFAEAMGLVICPKLRFITQPLENSGSSFPLWEGKLSKRQSKLERFKEKIREKRLKKTGAVEAPSEPDGGTLDDITDLFDINPAADAFPMETNEEATRLSWRLAVSRAAGRQKIRIRSDGTAKVRGLGKLGKEMEAEGHVFYGSSDSDGEGPKKMSLFEAAVASVHENAKNAEQITTDVHVDRLKRRLLVAAQTDKALHREKLRERRQHKTRKLRESTPDSDREDGGAVLLVGENEDDEEKS